MSKEPVYWTTKDGRKMNVDDMDDNHVRNTLKMLLRKIKAMQEEAKNPTPIEIRPQGEMAQMLHDQEIDKDAFDDMEPWDWK